jgi:mRNA interferase HigB
LFTKAPPLRLILEGFETMNVLNKPAIESFTNKHAESEKRLHTWVSILRRAEWRNSADVRRTWNSVNKVGSNYVFDVGADCRVIVTINFQTGFVRIKAIFTHAEYDRVDVKKL